MEENNLKYKILSGSLILVCLDLIYNIFRLFPIYTYKVLDITGIARPIQSTLIIILFLIVLSIGMYSLKIKEDGVNYKINKIISVVCFIFAIVAIFAFIYVRSSEEKLALQLESKTGFNFENPTSNDYEALMNLIDENINDKDYNKKVEIITQIKDYSVIERYTSIIIYNPNYEYRIEARGEIKYYLQFIIMAIVSMVESVFFFLNKEAPIQEKDIFYKNDK